MSPRPPAHARTYYKVVACQPSSDSRDRPYRYLSIYDGRTEYKLDQVTSPPDGCKYRHIPSTDSPPPLPRLTALGRPPLSAAQAGSAPTFSLAFSTQRLCRPDQPFSTRLGPSFRSFVGGATQRPMRTSRIGRRPPWQVSAHGAVLPQSQPSCACSTACRRLCCRTRQPRSPECPRASISC